MSWIVDLLDGQTTVRTPTELCVGQGSQQHWGPTGDCPLSDGGAQITEFSHVPLKYTCHYKYLGFVYDENIKFSEGRKILAESAGSALGSVLSKMKLCTDLGFSTFTQLYKSLVDSVLFYAAGVWGFEEVLDCNTVQNHALRCFLGVHKYAAKVAVEGDAGWDPCIVKQRCEMV